MPNSIINSDDGVVSGTSGIKTTGGDTGGMEFQSNGAIVFDYAPTQVVARQTLYAIDSGVPVIARSTDSNTYKYGMEDTSGGTQRGFLGANSSNALMVANGSATNVMNVTSAGLFQMNSGYGSVATAYGCRAWVNFDGTGTPAVIASGNVSSITDSGTGAYRANFATAMPDVNYAAFVAFNASAANAFVATKNLATTGYVRVDTGQNSAAADFSNISVAVFR